MVSIHGNLALTHHICMHVHAYAYSHAGEQLLSTAVRRLHVLAVLDRNVAATRRPCAERLATDDTAAVGEDVDACALGQVFLPQKQLTISSERTSAVHAVGHSVRDQHAQIDPPMPSDQSDTGAEEDEETERERDRWRNSNDNEDLSMGYRIAILLSGLTVLVWLYPVCKHMHSCMHTILHLCCCACVCMRLYRMLSCAHE